MEQQVTKQQLCSQVHHDKFEKQCAHQDAQFPRVVGNNQKQSATNVSLNHVVGDEPLEEETFKKETEQLNTETEADLVTCESESEGMQDIFENILR